MEVSAIEDNGSYLEHLLIGGELDVAVVVISSLRDRMALHAEILETSPYRLWLPLGHSLVSVDGISIDDVAKEPLIMLTVDEIEENTGKLLAALGARPHVAFRTRSVEAVRSLVATGAGVALLPDLVYRPGRLKGTVSKAEMYLVLCQSCRLEWYGEKARVFLNPLAILLELQKQRVLEGNANTVCEKKNSIKLLF